MSTWRILTALFFALCATAVAQEQENMALENSFMKVAISPQGGRVVSLKDLAAGNEIVTSQGMCLDREWKTRLGEMAKAVYSLKQVPGGVEASYLVKDPKLAGLEYTKTYLLPPDSPALTVALRIRNAGKRDRIVSPWVANQAMAGGTADDSDCIYIPAAGGLGQVRLANADKATPDYYVENPRAAWLALVDGKKQQGLVLLPEHDKLARFYVWCGAKPGTLEWVYREVTLKPGEQWTTTYSILPLHGLAGVTGASARVFASLVRAEDEAAQRAMLSLTSPFGIGQAEVIARVGDLELARSTVSLERGKTALLTWPASKAGAGDLGIEVQSAQGKERISILLADGDVPRAARIGHASAAQRGGPERFQIASEPIATNHIPWAKPLPGGPIRVLCLVPIPSQRDVDELAQRLEMECRLVAFQHPLMDAAAVEEFLEALEGRPYDVILFSKVPVGLLPSEGQEMLMARVREGAGMLSVNSSSTLKTGEALNIRDRGAFLETALPLHLLPESCRPSVRTGVCGKGRCVSLTYPGRVTCLTPEVTFEQVDYRDWECYFELLCRATLWAAKRESSVRIASAWPAVAEEEALDPWRAQRLVRVTQPALVRENESWQVTASEQTIPLATWTGYGAKVAVADGKLRITEANLEKDQGFGAGAYEVDLEQTPTLEVAVDSAKEWSLFIPDEHFEKAVATLQPRTAETGTKRYDLHAVEALRGAGRITLCFSTFGEGTSLVLGSLRLLKADGSPVASAQAPVQATGATNIRLRLASAADAEVTVTALYHGMDYYEGIEKRRQSVLLKGGQETEVTFPILNLCGGRPHAVDLTVCDRRGECLAFATTSYTVISPIVLPAPEAKDVQHSYAALAVKVENRGDARDAQARLSLSDIGGQPIGELDCPMKVPAGKSEQTVSVPTTRAGKVVASVQVSLSDAPAIALEKGSYLLSAFATEKELYRRGEEATLVANIENSAAEREAEFHVALTDMYGRLVAALDQKARIPAGKSRHKFSLPTAGSLTTLNRARLSVRDAKGLLLEHDGYVYLPEAQPAWDDYLVSTSQFGTRNAYTDPYFTQIAREAGIEGMVIGLRDTFEMLQQGTPLMYWGVGRMHFFGYNFKGEETSTARKPCLSDPEVRKAITATYDDAGNALRRYGPLAFASLEDESELSGARYCNLEVCTSEHCLKRYREWLKDKYKTLQALNEEWSSSQSSFDAIQPITYVEARKLANPAQWVDWHTFMEEVWLDGLLLTRKAVKKAYPELRMGFSNSFGQMPFAGWDFEQVSQHEDMSIEYPTVIFKLTPPREDNAFEEDAVDMSTVIRQKVDIRRSFLREDCPLPGWLWYDRSEQGAEFKPWWMAFLGTKGCTPWGPCSLGVQAGAKQMSFWAFLHPRLAQTKSSTWLASGVYDLTHGVGKIFVDYDRVVAPVAVLYSQPSMHVAWAWSTVEKAFYPEVTSLYAWYYKSRVNVTRMLRELGFAYRYIGHSQIVGGDLKNYRILFLPCSLCLSDEALGQIRQFVENGGVVVADIGAGATDLHGRPIPQRETMNGLFGLARKEICRTVEPAALRAADGGAIRVPADLRLAGMDTISPTAPALATREGGAPAIVVNKVGKGTAIYLNGFLGYNMPSRLFLREVLGGAGLSTPIRITSGGGEHMGYECATFRRAGIEIVGILRLRDEDAPTEVYLGEAKHLYDVRCKKYLGLTDRATLDLTRKAAAVLAKMPYEVSGVEVAVPQNAKAGAPVEVRAKVLGSAGPVGDHVLRMEVFDPAKRLSRAYTRNVLAVAGELRRSIPTAPNDAVGAWRVVVTDVISGKKAEASFQIGN